MHGRHGHHHHDSEHGDHYDDHTHSPGHNSHTGDPVQWQTPHLHDDHDHSPPPSGDAADLDLVEKAFYDGFAAAPDPTSFLRLAGVPFVGVRPDGTELRLLRVEQASAVDIGALTPHLGGKSFRYDPLPAAMTSRRDQIAFVYFDGSEPITLTFHEARSLSAKNEAL